MEPYFAQITAGIVGCLVSWGIIAGYYGVKYSKLRDKRRERLVDKRVVRDSHLAPMFGNAISDWDRVFTVKPVHTLDNGWVFCRYVWRRRIAKYGFLPSGGSDFWFQYLVKLQYVYD